MKKNTEIDLFPVFQWGIDKRGWFKNGTNLFITVAYFRIYSEKRNTSYLKMYKI